MNSDVMAGVHSSSILAGICVWKCRATLTRYSTLLVATMDCNKKHSERNSKFGLFNSASHAVIAHTAPKIGALKDRPNYSRASIGK